MPMNLASIHMTDPTYIARMMVSTTTAGFGVLSVTRVKMRPSPANNAFATAPAIVRVLSASFHD